MALRRQNAATVTFIMAGLMLAATLCEVGITSEAELMAARNLEHARPFFDRAARLAQITPMTKTEQRTFTAGCEHARVRLLELSELLYRLAER